MSASDVKYKEKLIKKINRLDLLCLRVIKTVSLEKLKFVDPETIISNSVPTPWMAASRPTILPYDVKNQQAIEKQSEELMLSASIRKTSNILCQYTQEQGEGWQAHLIKAFKELPNKNYIIDVAHHISINQILHLIDQLKNDVEHQEKLLYLIGSLHYTLFQEILLSLDEMDLTILNSLTLKASEEVQVWLRESVRENSQKFISTCNQTTTRVNDLCQHFRKDTSGKYIQQRDIGQINILLDETLLRIKQVDRLAVLYKGFIKHKETEHVLFQGLKKEYQSLLTRLTCTSTEVDPQRPAGCVWGIIYRNVFEGERDLADEDDAWEILQFWSIWTPEQYYQVGLLGNIGQSTFDELKRTQQVFNNAKAVLQGYGIKTIKDWKNKQIFNSGMLEHFLKCSTPR